MTKEEAYKLSQLNKWETSTFSNGFNLRQKTSRKFSKPINLSNIHNQIKNTTDRASHRLLRHQSPTNFNLDLLTLKADHVYHHIKMLSPHYIVGVPQPDDRNSKLGINISCNNRPIEPSTTFDIALFEKHLLSAHNIKELYSNINHIMSAANRIESGMD